MKLGVRTDLFSYQLISEETRIKQEASEGLPSSQNVVVLGVVSRWGRLNFNSFLVDGTHFRLELVHTIRMPQVTTQGVRVDTSLLYFKTLGLKSTLAFRWNLGFSSQTNKYETYFMGGLDAVRGFANQRFRGSFFWLGNVEWRVPSVDTRWVAVQHVLFMDALGMSEHAFEMWGLSGASVGIGLRVISPKIHGFIGRIGYALNLYGGDGPGLSMGGGQFY